jgi:hypothetical protein
MLRETSKETLRSLVVCLPAYLPPSNCAQRLKLQHRARRISHERQQQLLQTCGNKRTFFVAAENLAAHVPLSFAPP